MQPEEQNQQQGDAAGAPEEPRTPEDLPLKGVIGLSVEVRHGIQFLPDGSGFLAPLDKTLALYSFEDMTQPALLHSHKQAINCVAVSPSGRFAATGTKTTLGFVSEIRVWDLTSLQPIYSFDLHQVETVSLAFSWSEKYLVSIGGSDDNRIIVWDLEAGKALAANTIYLRTMNCVQFFHTSDTQIVTAGVERMYVWNLDVENRTLVYELVNLGQLKREYLDMVLDPDDGFLYASTRTGDIVQVNLRTRVFKGSAPGAKRPLSAAVTSLGTNMSGNIVGGTLQGELVLVRRDTMQIIQKGNIVGGVTSITECEGIPFFLVGTNGGSVYRVDRNTFEAELVLTVPIAPLTGVVFPDSLSKIFATFGGEGASVWHTQKLEEVLRICVPSVECLCGIITQDGDQIVTGWSDGAIRSFGPQSGRLLYTIRGAHERVTCLASTADGLRLYSGGSEGQIRQWIIAATHQDLERSLKQHTAPITKLLLSHDEKELCTSSMDGSCQVFTLPEMLRTQELKDTAMFTDCTYSDDETQLVSTGSDRFVDWWSVVSGELIRKLELSPTMGLTCVALSPCGRFLAIGSSDNLIRLVDYDSSETLAVGYAHSSSPTRVCFSPDSTRLISVGSDHAVCVWDVDRLTQ